MLEANEKDDHQAGEEEGQGDPRDQNEHYAAEPAKSDQLAGQTFRSNLSYSRKRFVVSGRKEAVHERGRDGKGGHRMRLNEGPVSGFSFSVLETQITEAALCINRTGEKDDAEHADVRQRAGSKAP